MQNQPTIEPARTLDRLNALRGVLASLDDQISAIYTHGLVQGYKKECLVCA